MSETTGISWFETILDRIDQEIASETRFISQSPHGPGYHNIRASAFREIRDILDAEYWPNRTGHLLDGKEHKEFPG